MTDCYSQRCLCVCVLFVCVHLCICVNVCMCVCVCAGVFVIDKMTVDSSISLANSFQMYK